MEFLVFLKNSLEAELGFGLELNENKPNQVLVTIQGSDHLLFEVSIIVTEIRIKIHIEPQKNGGFFMNLLSKTQVSERDRFCEYWSQVGFNKSKLKINEIEIDAKKFIELKETMNKFDFDFSLAPYFDDEASDQIKNDTILQYVLLTFKMMLSLIPYDIYGKEEGSSYNQISKRYERNPMNRQLCIKIKKCLCWICGFDFEREYGILGTGYIEVHHTIPVSQMGPNHKVNISEELYPVCSNCHRMLHRNSPPLSIEYLKEIVAYQKKIKNKI